MGSIHEETSKQNQRGATQCRRAATKAKKDGNLIVTDAHVMKK